MNPSVTPPALPPHWQNLVNTCVPDTNSILTSLELDLDVNLHFKHSLLLLTSQGLLYLCASGEMKSFPYQNGSALRQHDHAGLGTLTLLQGDTRIEFWRYTLSLDPAVQRFIRQFDRLRDSTTSGLPLEPEVQASCEQCGADLLEGHCPQCDNAEERPPSTWTLLRLWRFARPYRWQLLSGFLLMLASTAATLVPPYLTMPLMDK
ncbi:MAG: ABC transporter, partial [Gallionella sp.]